MAQLKDLLSSVPASVLQEQARYDREQVMREVARRKAASYQRRMEALDSEYHLFDQCKQSRPSKRKVQNRFSKEEAGTKGNVVMGVRTGRYSVCVCSVKQNY